MSMKKYHVVVNGVDYEVAIEAMKDGESLAAPAAQPTAAAPAAAPAGGERVTSPMPGTVLSVAVSDGTAVKAGQTLLVLEAMKMENEIVAPCDGRVASLSVTKGATVESGALLCVIA